MANIHPMLVHFPIAFLNGFFLMEVIGFISKREEFRAAARWMLYLGTLGALVAVAAGLRGFVNLPACPIDGRCKRWIPELSYG